MENKVNNEVTEEQVLAAMLEGYREHVQKLNHEINKLRGESCGPAAPIETPKS